MEELVIIEYSKSVIHFYKVDNNADINEDYIEKLGFNTNEVISSRESCYSIVTYNTGAFGNALHDILTDDVLLPAARIF